MLEVEALEGGYGRSQVLFQIELRIAPGQLVTLLGRNGMGKSTTVRNIVGLNKPWNGKIEFEGQSLLRREPEDIARLGIGLVPEGRQIFPTLTVRENLVAVAANRLRHGDPWTLQKIYELFPSLCERQSRLARTLSGGEQQMLATGRALMTNPKLLILDEATEGLAPIVRGQIWSCLRALKRSGLSILVIDKNIEVLKSLADRHFVIEKGRAVWSGSSSDLAANSDLAQRYIGI